MDFVSGRRMGSAAQSVGDGGAALWSLLPLPMGWKLKPLPHFIKGHGLRNLQVVLERYV